MLVADLCVVEVAVSAPAPRPKPAPAPAVAVPTKADVEKERGYLIAYDPKVTTDPLTGQYRSFEEYRAELYTKRQQEAEARAIEQQQQQPVLPPLQRTVSEQNVEDIQAFLGAKDTVTPKPRRSPVTRPTVDPSAPSDGYFLTSLVC